jgi:hypothetical protein
VVTKGESVRLKLLSDTTLNVGFESKDFAFGVLPSKNRDGWINFPNTKATEPCIHDFTARKVTVNLPVKKDASELSCTWSESEKVEVENIPPRSAEITGRFNPKENRSLTYSLSHPKYLFGKMMFEQFVRFCPVPTDTEKWDDPSSGPYTYDQNDVCLCCDSEFCHEDCDCICAGTCKDDYLEEDNNVVNLDHICPIHMLLFEDCANLHENEYTNALHKQHLSGVLYIREPIEFEQIPLEVPTTYSNCCSCVDHWTNYVALAYKSKRLLLLDSQNEPFRITETSCVVRLAGVTPSYSINDSQLMFSRNGQIYHEQERTVLGVDIKTKTDNCKKYNLLNPNFGVPVTICTNIENATELNLVTNVKLPTGNIHLELIGTTGHFTVWYYDYEIGSYRKLLDSDTVSTKTVSIRNWRKIMKSSLEGDFTDLPIYVTSSVPGNTKLVFRYWAVIEDKFVEDTVEQKITSILPPIRMDINHDNIINEDDVGLYLDGGLFRFWCNSETVKGDFVGQF